MLRPWERRPSRNTGVELRSSVVEQCCGLGRRPHHTSTVYHECFSALPPARASLGIW